MLVDTPHNKGVLVFGNGLGGGRQRAARGDRYAGIVAGSLRWTAFEVRLVSQC